MLDLASGLLADGCSIRGEVLIENWFLSLLDGLPPGRDAMA